MSKMMQWGVILIQDYEFRSKCVKLKNVMKWKDGCSMKYQCRSNLTGEMITVVRVGQQAKMWAWRFWLAWQAGIEETRGSNTCMQAVQNKWAHREWDIHELWAVHRVAMPGERQWCKSGFAFFLILLDNLWMRATDLSWMPVTICLFRQRWRRRQEASRGGGGNFKKR